MFIKVIYLSMFIATHPSIINPIPEPNTTPEKTLFLFLSLIELILAPVPKILCIALITNCIGYINENILIKFLSTNIPSKNHPKIGVTDVKNVSKPILNNLFILFLQFTINYSLFLEINHISYILINCQNILLISWFVLCDNVF